MPQPPHLLVATATEFAPKQLEANAEVLNPSFITQTVPRVHRFAAVVGLCVVPEERAGMNDLGWHVADFLAWRTLLNGENPHKAQTWLSMCDIPALVEKNPELYVHGKDKRLVGSAAEPGKQEISAKGHAVDREDNIRVETSAELLKEKLIMAVKEKMAILKKLNYPLLLIICGMTSLEQDIYFGKLDVDHRCTLHDLRSALGDDINQVATTVVTPSLFSAGWKVNIAFGRPPSPASMRASKMEFLARQFGGLFAKDLVTNFLGWKCPVLDVYKVDPSIIREERFPGPAMPSDEVKTLIPNLQVKIQSCLMGQLSAHHMDHSFSFDSANDDWSALIEERVKGANYPSLDWYEQKWAKLPSAQSVESAEEGFTFMGNAFGGTRTAQVNHLRYLIEESYLAWQDHWASNFGRLTKQDFERFLSKEKPDDLDCHEIFNVLEHRATTSILADMVVQYFDLPMPHKQRCRDWNYRQWKEELQGADQYSLGKSFGAVFSVVPGPNVPPGINPNNLSRLQRRLENAADYVRTSLGIRFLTSKTSSQVAIDKIHYFIQEVKAKQGELLALNPVVYDMCCAWLKAIDMPVRKLDTTMSTVGDFHELAAPVISTGIVDDSAEYEVILQHEEHQPHPTENNVASQKQPSEAIAPQSNVAPAELPITHTKQNKSVDGADENIEEVRRIKDQLIAALHTNNAEELHVLTAKLLSLLNKGQEADSASQAGAAMVPDDNANVTTAAVGATANGHRNADTKRLESDKDAKPKDMVKTSALVPQDPNKALPPHKRMERVETFDGAENRKILPHLRALRN